MGKHLAHAYPGERRAYDKQRARHRDVADHRHRLANDVRHVDAQGHDDGGDIGGHHHGACQHLQLEVADGALALDEHHANGEDEKRVGHVEQGGVEYGLRAEDARHDGVADEPHVAKQDAEAYHALLKAVVADELGQRESHDGEKRVGDEAHAQQGEDETRVGQLVAHDGREDEQRATNVDNQRGQTLVEVAAHEPEAAERIT